MVHRLNGRERLGARKVELLEAQDSDLLGSPTEWLFLLEFPRRFFWTASPETIFFFARSQ